MGRGCTPPARSRRCWRMRLPSLVEGARARGLPDHHALALRLPRLAASRGGDGRFAGRCLRLPSRFARDRQDARPRLLGRQHLGGAARPAPSGAGLGARARGRQCAARQAGDARAATAGAARLLPALALVPAPLPAEATGLHRGYAAELRPRSRGPADARVDLRQLLPHGAARGGDDLRRLRRESGDRHVPPRTSLRSDARRPRARRSARPLRGRTRDGGSDPRQPLGRRGQRRAHLPAQERGGAHPDRAFPRGDDPRHQPSFASGRRTP